MNRVLSLMLALMSITWFVYGMVRDFAGRDVPTTALAVSVATYLLLLAMWSPNSGKGEP